MHQPEYYAENFYQLPWTYLHGIKDYIDMAAHLEAIPQARAVVNFTPTLLEQIDDYHQQIQAHLAQRTPLKDPLLHALVRYPFCTTQDTPEQQLAERQALVWQCLRINRERLIERFADYARLAELADWLLARPELLRYLDEQYFVDLVVWYHLAWLGESVRRTQPQIQALINKGSKFTLADRHQLMRIIGDLLGSIIPRYRRLADAGRVELSVTPYAHPIMPLLLNLHSASEAMPNAHLPAEADYPEGKARARWHMREALRTFQHYFGRLPCGCWPSEGAVSTATVRLMEEFNIRWIASGETVLHNSLQQAHQSGSTHQQYRLHNGSVRCFFRDDRLSDLIGFEYSRWHADDAVANLIHHLENLADHIPDGEHRVVSIILDGENAWEYYPENGYYFLNCLYQRLAEHPRLEMTTFQHCLPLPTQELPALVAGSWVYGTLSTWIGDADKNRGWEMLIAAKQVFDKVVKTLSSKQREAAERQLAICEGSDWFWWFGDYNPTDSVSDFDRLYRAHLKQLYHLLGKSPPYYLYEAFSHGGGDPEAGGMMRRGQQP